MSARAPARVLDGRDLAALEAARELLTAPGDADDLYTRWFHGGTPGATVTFPTAVAYTAATTDPARFDGGWEVLADDQGAPGALAVRHRAESGQDEVRLVTPPGYLPGPRAALVPEPGDTVRVDPLTTATAGGFWHVWSAGWRRRGAPDRLTRVYLAAAPGSEPAVARAVLAHGPVEDRWYVKCATGTHGHTRRDVVVLYLPRDEALPGWVRRVLDATAGARSVEAPPLTVPLGPGAGLAADPGDGTSFGQAVCERLGALAAESPAVLADPGRWADAATSALVALLPTESDR